MQEASAQNDLSFVIQWTFFNMTQKTFFPQGAMHLFAKLMHLGVRMRGHVLQKKPGKILRKWTGSQHLNCVLCM